MKENELVAYNLLNKPDVKRSIFLEGVILLEMLIDNIILTYFFSYPKEGKLHLTDHAKDFEKDIFYNPEFDLGYNKKIKLLKLCGVISSTKFKELEKIGSDRNKAAHRMGMQINREVTGWFKGSEKERKSTKSITELITTDDDVEEYKKKCSECYAYLMVKILSLYNPHREDFKIE